MFNSSSAITLPPPPKPYGKDAAGLPTDEHGRPVPYLPARSLLGRTWISEPWKVRSVPARKKVRKKSQTVGYNYFASFAGLLRVGPDLALKDTLDERGARFMVCRRTEKSRNQCPSAFLTPLQRTV